MSIMVATGKGATQGVLFRNAEAIELLCQVDTLLFDKTGTLTEGRPAVVQVVAAPGVAEAEVLRVAASLDRESEHPLGEAIVRAASERELAVSEVTEFESLPGKGVVAGIEGRPAAVGNATLLKDQKVELLDFASAAEQMRRDAQTVVYVAIDGQLAGLIGVADPIKATTPQALAELRRAGLRLLMLSGDSQATADAVGRTLGLDEVIGDALPQHKAEVVQRLTDEGCIVAMAGDGVNDAPALALSHVGIAMGTGTDVAMESAGVTLVRGDLRGIVRARQLSEATMTNIRQNLFFALLYNGLGVPIAAGLLYPFTGLLLSPMLAAAAMSLSSVSVIANALRLGASRS
jgi:Cu+-exporting ATPase